MGFGHAEFFDSKFVSASLRLMHRLSGRHHLLFEGSVAEQNRSLDKIFDGKSLWGLQAGYFFDSGILGPLGATLSWSSYTERLHFYVTLGFDF